MKRIATTLALVFGLGLYAVPSMAQQPANPARLDPTVKSCWGQVSAQRAVNEGDLGAHSSEQSSPRLGLGNATRFFGFTHVGEFGQFLASADGIDATECAAP